MHIPHDPNYYEQHYFSPGDLGYIQVNTGKAIVAPLICYDQWYPEAARVNAIQGAQIIFYPTAIGWFKELKRDEPFSARRWEDAMRAHASLNGIFVAAANRVGREGDLQFGEDRLWPIPSERWLPALRDRKKKCWLPGSI